MRWLERFPSLVRRARKLRTIAVICATGLLGFVFVLCCTLSLKQVRAFAVAQVNNALDGLFLGRPHIESVARLGLTGVEGANATIFDADRHAVLIVRGVNVRLAVMPLIWAMVVHPRVPLTINLLQVTVDHAEVWLIDAGHGVPTLGVAFLPRHTNSSVNSPPIPTIHIRSIAVSRAWVHGQLASAPVIDADIEHASARLDIVAARLRLQLNRADLHTRRLPSGMDLVGVAGGIMDLPIAAPAGASSGAGAGASITDIVAHAWYNGQLAGSRINTTFDWDAGKIAASLDAPHIESASVARLTPELNLRDPLILRATAQGTLSSIAFEIQALVDEPARRAASMPPRPATLVIMGHAALGQAKVIDAELRAQHVNLADLRDNAPESGLDGVAHVKLMYSQWGAITGQYDLSTQPGVISGTQIPAFVLQGSLNPKPAQAFATNGHAQILEPGAATTIEYSVTLTPKSKVPVVAIESFTAVSNPKRLRTLANGLRVQGSIKTSAHFWPTDGRWNAHLQARLRDIQHARLSAGSIELRVEAAGGQIVPSGSVHMHARDVNVATQTFRTLDLVAHGTLTRSLLVMRILRDDAQQFNLTTELGLAPTVHAHDIRLALPADKGEIAVSVDDIGSTGGALHIDALHLEGAGTADASLTLGHEIEQLDVSTESFDWVRIARLLGLKLPVRSGTVTLAAHYANSGEESRGTLQGRASQVDLGPYHDANVNVDLMLSRGLVSGVVAAQLAPDSNLSISVRSFPINHVDRPNLVLSSRDFSLSLRAAMNLATLLPWIRRLDVPLERASGTVLLELSALGPSHVREQPQISARIATRSLQLAGQCAAPTPTGTRAIIQDARVWSLRDIDGNIDLSIAGVRPSAVASAQLYDEHGLLVEVRASADLPPGTWHTLRVAGSEARVMPLAAHISVRGRPLQDLAPVFWTQSLRGVASVEVELGGTLDDPQLVVDGTVRHFAPVTNRSSTNEQPELDLSVHADGSLHRGKVRIAAQQQSATVGSLQANWNGDLSRLAGATPNQASPVQGDVFVRLRRFPLGALPPFRDRQMFGAATGNVDFRNWGLNASLVGKLEIERLQIGRVVIDRSLVAVNGVDGQLVASARLTGRSSGTLDANVTTKMTWADRCLPIIDPHVTGGFRAKHLQLGLVSPFLNGSVNELAGAVDANLGFTLDQGIARMEGQATLSNGVLQIPSIGQRFDSIRALAKVHDGTLNIDDIQARGLTGRVTGNARVKLDGLSPTSGDMHLGVSRDEQIPITIEGQAMGDAWGRIDAIFNRHRATNTTNFRVDVPELHFDLPDVDPKDLQTLDLASNVRIGARRSDGYFASLPLQALATDAQAAGETLVVDVHLGNSVWIQKGPGIKVQLTGDLLASMAEKTTLEGRLELRGGRLDVSGKTFEVERGTVSFNRDDAGNPSINATARWNSPAGYSVYAEYVGSVQKGELKLRSEPALSADKVLGLLMFGTPDGTLGTSGSQNQGSESASAAVGIAGDTAVKGLNKAVAGLTKLDISARLDTSAGDARPELDAQLTPRVTVRMTRAIGEPAAGQSPDRTYLTIELRLLRAWSLSAVVGDHGGSGLDLLWRRRY